MEKCINHESTVVYSHEKLLRASAMQYNAVGLGGPGLRPALSLGRLLSDFEPVKYST